MNNNDLPKGYISLDSEKKKRSWLSPKYLVTLFVFLVVTSTIKIINDGKARDTVNKQALVGISAVRGLPPQAQEHFQDIRKRADEICRKYLTTEEYTRSASSGLKISQGIAKKECRSYASVARQAIVEWLENRKKGGKK
jgi:hypothetical protein